MKQASKKGDVCVVSNPQLSLPLIAYVINILLRFPSCRMQLILFILSLARIVLSFCPLCVCRHCREMGQVSMAIGIVYGVRHHVDPETDGFAANL
jgi:hypothetical protein